MRMRPGVTQNGLSGGGAKAHLPWSRSGLSGAKPRAMVGELKCVAPGVECYGLGLVHVAPGLMSVAPDLECLTPSQVYGSRGLIYNGRGEPARGLSRREQLG